MAVEKSIYELELEPRYGTTYNPSGYRQRKITIYRDKIVYYVGIPKRPDPKDETTIKISDMKRVNFEKEYFLGFIPRGYVFRIYTKDGKNIQIKGVWTDYATKLKLILAELIEKNDK